MSRFLVRVGVVVRIDVALLKARRFPLMGVLRGRYAVGSAALSARSGLCCLLLTAEPPDGGGRDFAVSEALLLFSSRMISKASPICSRRASLPQSRMFRTWLRKFL